VDDLVKALGIDSGISKSEYRGSAPTSTWKWRRSVTARHVGVGLDHGRLVVAFGVLVDSKEKGRASGDSRLSVEQTARQCRRRAPQFVPVVRVMVVEQRDGWPSSIVCLGSATLCSPITIWRPRHPRP
jgi:hypothetical protein